MDVGGVFGPFVALAAGSVSFMSPCVLPLVPIYVAQLAGASATGAAAGRRETFLRAVAFVLGFSTIFILLGASVGFVGALLRDHLDDLTRAAGLLLIVLGLHQSGILRIPLLYRGLHPSGPARPAGYAGWALVGGAVSVGWVPCVGPVLGSILTLATAEGTAAQGALLLAFYSAGLAVPFLITGLLAGSAVHALHRAKRWLPVVEVVSGLLLIAAGILIFTNRLTILNQYFDLFGLGESGL
jgi:cytochrome c-type biogenesis protein